MKLGFTGTRNGASAFQCRQLVLFIRNNNITELHHGDCIGADKQSHDFMRFWNRDCKIIVHPPVIDTYRSWCQGDEIREPLDYLTRDRNIVDSVNLLIACPETDFEIRRSGTWYTIRYARKIGLEYIIFKRNG